MLPDIFSFSFKFKVSIPIVSNKRKIPAPLYAETLKKGKFFSSANFFPSSSLTCSLSNKSDLFETTAITIYIIVK